MPDDRDLLTMVATKLEALHQDMADIKAAQKNTAEALGKLAILEERQITYQTVLKQAETEIQQLKDKLLILEIANASHSRVGRLVDAGITGAVALLAMFIASKVGLT